MQIVVKVFSLLIIVTNSKKNSQRHQQWPLI
jgi:hypothetical protein